MKQIIAGFLGALALSGCQHTPAVDPAGAVALAVEDLPPPTTNDLRRTSVAYTVGPADELTVSVFGAPDLGGDFIVDPDGRLTVPLVGEIDAAGLSISELAAQITRGLQPYVKQPRVAVNLKEMNSRTFAVDGEVREPGVFRASGELTLMRAIATAKGTTVEADEEDVVVFRTVAGKDFVALYNLAAIRRGTYKDPQIYPNDVIVVGDSPTQRLIRELLPTLTTPAVLLLQTLRSNN